MKQVKLSQNCFFIILSLSVLAVLMLELIKNRKTGSEWRTSTLKECTLHILLHLPTKRDS